MPRQAVSGKRLSVWTTLPGSPIDGDEILYRFVPNQTPATTIPILWHLRWDATTSAWLPVNQAEPILAGFAAGAGVSVGNNSWGTYDANDPRITVPRAGVYEMETGCSEAYGPSQSMILGFGVNGAVPIPAGVESSTAMGTPYSPQAGGAQALKVVEQTLAVNDNVRQYYYNWYTSASTIVMRGRYVQIRPRKITG